jgi:hypothetical protein
VRLFVTPNPSGPGVALSVRRAPPAGGVLARRNMFSSDSFGSMNGVAARFWAGRVGIRLTSGPARWAGACIPWLPTPPAVPIYFAVTAPRGLRSVGGSEAGGRGLPPSRSAGAGLGNIGFQPAGELLMVTHVCTVCRCGTLESLIFEQGRTSRRVLGYSGSPGDSRR